MKHNNPSLTERGNRVFNSKGSDVLSDEVQGPYAVIEINKPIQRYFQRFARTSTGSATGTAFATDRDTYITNATLYLIKDAACDLATHSIAELQMTVDGLSRSIIAIPIITLTAQQQAVTVQFNPPIKVDRGTTPVISTNTYTAGIMNRTVIISGYFEDVTK